MESLLGQYIAFIFLSQLFPLSFLTVRPNPDPINFTDRRQTVIRGEGTARPISHPNIEAAGQSYVIAKYTRVLQLLRSDGVDFGGSRGPRSVRSRGLYLALAAASRAEFKLD
jgi:hypothetical protein